MKIIPETEAFDIDVKRFYTPFHVEDTCPECGHNATWGPDQDYLSYPTVNAPFDLTMYCTECDHNWEHRVILRVTLETVP